MGLGEWVRRKLDAPVEPVPEDWVVLTVRPPLPAHGFDRYRIVVRQRDLAEATEILGDLRAPGPPPDPFDVL